MEQTPQHPQLHSVSQRLAEDEDILVGLAFGSMVNGTATPESDLDVGVLCAGPLPAEKRRALIHDLGQCLGRPVDLVDLRTAGVPVRRQALPRAAWQHCWTKGDRLPQPLLAEAMRVRSTRLSG
ncbi:type VII toxin-antitoxin system MntA family adenylyltransferase antitoxin [Halorhodospira halophila]|uniref:DNA polymerase, beta domain protein region n=1 Tax=Halorhodospira halophila (strain DSM 244 / SL1) TaxID=349124 RepID=A1WV21_HALHL|nr:nucleotidyltransferase domain-containing protein [Halorhodospira halophila]ABM61533.1 DNA polymerase, beta domain protein region [Halorhodospira halophila SL1]MBK1728781.1 nucleotidyltransferase domain-containing protein [Halorhodospira halophila]